MRPKDEEGEDPKFAKRSFIPEQPATKLSYKGFVRIFWFTEYSLFLYKFVSLVFSVF